MGNKHLIIKLMDNELKEYSVIHTERSKNLMSKSFIDSMKSVIDNLRITYNAPYVAIVPGSGTFAMEAVARQFTINKSAAIIRNGWFSFRWTQILETCQLTKDIYVLSAVSDNDRSYKPHPIDKVLLLLKEKKPSILF